MPSRPGRRRPYTVIGIRRLTCLACGERPAEETVSACADGNLHRPVCSPCARSLDARLRSSLGSLPASPGRPRRTPYAWATIARRPCAWRNCGNPSAEQWDWGGPDWGFFPVCRVHDLALNRLVLRFLDDPEADAKLERYARRCTAPPAAPPASAGTS